MTESEGSVDKRERVRKSIETIEESRNLLLNDKFDLICLILDLRRVMFPGFGGPMGLVNKADEIPVLDQKLDEKTEELVALAEKLNLKYRVVERGAKEKLGNAYKGSFPAVIIKNDIFFAKNDEDIVSMIKAQKEGDNMVMGELLGYPPTAVQAFSAAVQEDKVKDLLASDKEIEDHCTDDPDLPAFIKMGLSRANIREELNIIRKNVELVREYAPILCEQIIQDYRLRKEARAKRSETRK